MLLYSVIIFTLVLIPLGQSIDDGDYPDYPDEQFINVYAGWPSILKCAPDTLPYDDETAQPDEDAPLTCVIWIDGVVVFNKTFLGTELEDDGLFEIVLDKDRDGALVNVSLYTGDGYVEESSLKITVMDLPEPICLDDSRPNQVTDGVYTDVMVGGERELFCTTPEPIDLSVQQFKAINTTWYRNCEKILRNDPEYEYIATEDFDGFDPKFDTLKILNVSLSTTPGTYHCSLEHNGAVLHANAERLCVKKEYKHANQPQIEPSQKKIVAKPGDDVELQCVGQTGTSSISASQLVNWEKNGTSVCTVHLSPLMPLKGNCTSEVHENRNYCEPLSEEEITAAMTHRLDDNFTTTYTLRKVTYEDAGTYKCILITTRYPDSAEMVLIVRDEEATHSYLAIALIVVGVFIGIALLALLLLRIFHWEVRYLFKKIFGSYHEINGNVAYVVYCPDAFENPKNPVNDVLKWFREVNYRFYDRNGGEMGDFSLCEGNNNAGAPAADHANKMLEKCPRLVVIVTTELFNDDKWEIFEAYQGFDENVRRNLKMVFVCTKKMEINIKKNNGDRYVTFQRFMRRRGNYVIYWKENDHAYLSRALYVAMPKVKRPSRRQFASTIYVNGDAV